MSELRRFHDEMAALDGPMVVVTVATGARRAGCLVGFHTQVSIDPARYLVCLSVNNHTYRLAADATHLGVHFLSGRQLGVAERFGTSCSADTDKFADLVVSEGPGGAPVLADCAHWFVGEIHAVMDLGDHVAFGLEPVASGGADEREPLLGFQAVRHLDAAHAP